MDYNQYTSFVAFYILTAICIILNIIVLIDIALKKYNTPFLRLIKFFHLSIIGDVFTALPFIFKQPIGLCLAFESFKFYFGLMNILIIFFLVQAHQIHLFEQSKRFVTSSVRRYVYLFVFIFPCIVFLPFITDDYVDSECAWCTLTWDRGGTWLIFIQYMWVWLVLLANFFTNIRIIHYITHHAYDRQLVIKFCLNVIFYSIICGISWIPRFYEMWETSRDDDENSTVLRFYQFFPISIAGILYCFLFFINRKVLLEFEQSSGREGVPGSQSNDFLTFKTNDLLTIVDESGGPNTNSFSGHGSFLNLINDFFRFSASKSTTQRDSSLHTTGSDLVGLQRRSSLKETDQEKEIEKASAPKDREKEKKQLSELQKARILSGESADGITLNPVLEYQRQIRQQDKAPPKPQTKISVTSRASVGLKSFRESRLSHSGGSESLSTARDSILNGGKDKENIDEDDTNL
jgi:hypothetical protein